MSDPSAKILDTGEALKTETLKGDGDHAREAWTSASRCGRTPRSSLIRFPPVKKGQSVRLRIEETYTDPARYDLVDGQLMWRRSFGRPRNDHRPARRLVFDGELDSRHHLVRQRTGGYGCRS